MHARLRKDLEETGPRRRADDPPARSDSFRDAVSEEFRPPGELPPDELPSDERLTAPRLFLFVVAGLLAWVGLYYLILHLA